MPTRPRPALLLLLALAVPMPALADDAKPEEASKPKALLVEMTLKGSIPEAPAPEGIDGNPLRDNLDALLAALADIGVERVTTGYLTIADGAEDDLKQLLRPWRWDGLVLDAYAKGFTRRRADGKYIRYLPKSYRQRGYALLMSLAANRGMTVGISSLSYALALAVRKQDWMFWVVQQTVLFPLLILSGMLLPLEGGPGWMQALSSVNPLTYVVDAERALFTGDILSTTVLWGFLAAAVTAAGGLALGIRSMRHTD